MAAVFAVWVASCASLYAQLPQYEALGGVLEAFPDQPPTLQANVIVSAALGLLLLLKVREGPGRERMPAAVVVACGSYRFVVGFAYKSRHARLHCSIPA